MKNLKERLDNLIIKKKLPWVRRGRSIIVPTLGGTRKHAVRTQIQDGRICLYSVVLRARDIPRSNRKKLDLIYRAWRKNALKEFVAFSFDEDGNLAGVIKTPLSTLIDSQLIQYIEILAIEADRFEYKLTGQDRE